MRSWSMIGDNALIISRSVPRRWSANLASKGFLSYDSENNKNVVNGAFATALKRRFDNLTSLVEDKVTRKKGFSYE
uniref:Uncharacterized protein n=1 Tax=Dulem virus 42 TaxID=3145760 RepID=A0AAU8B7S0_9CAUD